MSKYVKQLVTDHIKSRLVNIQYAMLVSFVGLDSNKNHSLRTALAEKGVEMMMIKNSLARRATEGTTLNALFHNIEGSLALCWGAEDIVSLAKVLVKLTRDKNLKGFEIKAAVLDGEKLEAAAAVDVSKWPNREEQIAILLGQIVGVGAKLSSQMISLGGGLASQIKQLAEKEGDA
jgi:ribosomal protein L10